MSLSLKCFLILLGGVALAAGAPAVRGQAEITAETPKPRYRVEIVVFRHLDPSMRSPEDLSRATQDGVTADEWQTPGETDIPADTGGEPRVFSDLTVSETPGGSELGIEAMPDALSILFEPIDPEELRLGRIAEALQRPGAYAPLIHVGWIQEGYPREETIALEIGEWAPDAPVTGTITLWSARFLHLEVDLSYWPNGEARLSRTPAPGTPADGFDELRQWAPTPSVTYRIVENRRMRRDETHYFDHPYFGVIARITADLPAEGSEDLEPQSSSG